MYPCCLIINGKFSFTKDIGSSNTVERPPKARLIAGGVTTGKPTADEEEIANGATAASSVYAVPRAKPEVTDRILMAA